MITTHPICVDNDNVYDVIIGLYMYMYINAIIIKCNEQYCAFV